MTRAIERRTVSARVMPFPLTPPPMRRDDLEVWTDTRYQLLSRVRTAAKRGEVREVGAWKPVPGAAGWFSVQVWRLKPETPRWKRILPGVLGGLALVVAGLVGIGWAIATAVAAIGVALASVPVIVWVVLGVVLLAGGGGATTVIVKVIVR